MSLLSAGSWKAVDGVQLVVASLVGERIGLVAWLHIGMGHILAVDCPADTQVGLIVHTPELGIPLLGQMTAARNCPEKFVHIADAQDSAHNVRTAPTLCCLHLRIGNNRSQQLPQLQLCTH